MAMNPESEGFLEMAEACHSCPGGKIAGGKPSGGRHFLLVLGLFSFIHWYMIILAILITSHIALLAQYYSQETHTAP